MASNYLAKRHDIAVTNVGTAGSGTDLIGMMLARTSDGGLAYEELDGKYLADQFFTGAPSQVNMNPEEELILSQDDWRSGFGLEYFDSADTKRYFSSIGMDLRFRGMAIAGPTPTTVTKPTTTATSVPLALNTDMEDNSDWTGGARASDQAYQGTYSWKRSTNGTMSQTCTVWTTAWRSKAFTFKAWVRSSGVNIARVYISDGIGTTNGSNNGGTGTWAQVTVTRTLDAAATQLVIGCENQTAGAEDVWFDLCEITGPASTGVVKVWCEFNDALYMGSGNVLSKLNGTGTTFDAVGTLPGVISDLAVMTISKVDYLFIALGSNTPYWYITTAEAFTQSTAATARIQFLCLVNAASPTMWGNDGVNTIRSTTNPLNGGTAWSAQTTVDTAYNSITDLISYNGALYIPKEDMPYYLNSSGAVQSDLAPELKSLTASTSGKNTVVWKNALYIPAGAQALLETDGTTNTFRNPSSYCTNLTDFVGRVQALGYDEEYLFAVVDNSTKVEVLAGRLETIGSTTSWVWHPIAEITLTNCETAFASSIYQKRIWIASNTATEDIYYIPLPTGYGDMVNDANRKFKTATTFETSWLHGDFKADDKAWIKLTLTMGHTYNAGRYFTAKYKKLGDTSWTTIGNYTGSATSMVQSRYIDTTNKPFSSMMKFQFTAVTDDTTITPILHTYDVRAIMYPTIRRIIHCVVKCSDEVECKDGLLERNMRATIKTTLDNARDNAVWPVSIRDLDGTTINVKFLPVTQSITRMMEVKREKGRTDERLYHLLLMEVALS